MSIRHPAGLSFLCIIILAAMTGCGSSGSVSLRQAVADYDAGRFHVARTRAAEVQTRQVGLQREQAAYVAGLAAYRLQDFAEAERRFTAALETDDATLRAHSQAMLGLVRLEQRRPTEAARLLQSASRDLTGTDRTRATYFAAQAHEQAGDRLAAGQLYALGAGTGTAATPRVATADAEHRGTSGASGGGASGGGASGGGAGFAIQVGAFAERQRAEAAAETVRSLASVNGLNPVRVAAASNPRGQRLFVVQFGEFDSRQDAERTRRDLGRLDYIVARVAN